MGTNILGVIVPNPTRRQQPSSPRLLPSPTSYLNSNRSFQSLPLLPIEQQENIVQLAWRHNLPVWTVDTLNHVDVLTFLTDLNPDLICVVCFPYLFPKALLVLPPQGCLNIHPSLLPAYRGPDPLYWILQHGLDRTGVTLHFLDESLDTGDIVFQTAFDLPKGISEMALSDRCAIEGAALLAEAIRHLKNGSLPRQPQATKGASYYPSRPNKK